MSIPARKLTSTDVRPSTFAGANGVNNSPVSRRFTTWRTYFKIL